MTTSDNPNGHDCTANHCHAKRRQDGGPPCHKPAGWATEHVGAGRCKLHGGNTPDQDRQAKAELARRQARAVVVARFGDREETNAHRELGRLINISAGLVSFYEWQCRQLSPDALIWGDTEAREDFRGVTVTQKAEVNMWLRLYNEERRELRALCRDAITAGLAEREVRLAEQHGALVAEVLRLVLSDLELTPAQQTRALNVVPLRLREYAAGPESDTSVVPDGGAS